MGEIWKTAIADTLSKFLAKIVSFLPNLLAMITILIVGFFIAWLIRILLLRFLKALQFDRVSEGWGLTVALSKGGVTYSASNLVSRFFYWLIILVTLILGINALELAVTRSFIIQFFNYLPHFFTAILILIVGYLIAIFLSQATLIAAVNAQMASAKMISRVVRWFIIILSFTMGLYHLGIAEKVIIAAFSITFGGIILASAIAFGWGGRELAKNFLEGLYKEEETKSDGPDQISHI
jgi:hypothetical protein